MELIRYLPTDLYTGCESILTQGRRRPLAPRAPPPTKVRLGMLEAITMTVIPKQSQRKTKRFKVLTKSLLQEQRGAAHRVYELAVQVYLDRQEALTRRGLEYFDCSP